MPIWAYQGAGWSVFAFLDPYQSLTAAVCRIVQTGAVLTQKQNYRASGAFMSSTVMWSKLGCLQG